VGYSAQLGGALTALDVEVRWLTSWGSEVNKLLVPGFGWE
jgi:hypothetical protein